MLDMAGEVDRGFNEHVLAEMMQTLDRFTDDEIPIDRADVAALRAFFRQWSVDLTS